MRPLISIIIPTFNEGHLLYDCLDSIMQQDSPIADVECVVTSDGESNLFDAQFRSKLQDLSSRGARSRLVRLDVNSGPGPSRDAGVGVASGEYLMFLDADDTLTSGACMALRQALKLHEPDILLFDWLSLDSGKISDKPSDRARMKMAEMSYADRLSAFAGMEVDGSVIYALRRRDLVMANCLRFRPGLHEDVDYAFREYLIARSMVSIIDPIYVKRPRIGSVMSSLTSARISGLLSARFAILDEIEVRNEYLRDRGIDIKSLRESGLRGLRGTVGLVLKWLSEVPMPQKEKLNQQLNKTLIERSDLVSAACLGTSDSHYDQTSVRLFKSMGFADQ